MTTPDQPALQRVPRDSPPMQVELEVPTAKVAALFAKTSAQWQHLGATEPHWSVLTDEGFRQSKLATNRSAFYKSGEYDVMAFAAALARAGLQPDQGGRLVELGCGVGRATAYLARHVGQVVAVDISDPHLRLARQHVREAGFRNVEFRQLQSIDDVARLGAFDALFSLIVLQHNPPPVMHRLLHDLLTLLRPGGVAYFQVPTYRIGYRFAIDEYLAHRNETDMEMHCLPQAVLFDLLHSHGCRLVDLREDDSIGGPERSISNTLLVQKRHLA